MEGLTPENDAHLYLFWILQTWTYLFDIWYVGWYRYGITENENRVKKSKNAPKKHYQLRQTRRVIKSVGGFPISLSLDLCDKLVSPILLYGSEIWVTQY